MFQYLYLCSCDMKPTYSKKGSKMQVFRELVKDLRRFVKY